MNNNFFSNISKVAPVTVIVCGLLASGAAAMAQSESGPDNNPSNVKPCSNATLSGDYGFVLEGVILGPGFPIRGVVMQHYDGNGHITQIDHIVTNGVPPALAWTRGTGSYTVHPDCTGFGVINSPSNPVPVNLHFVVVNGGRQINQVVDANAVTAVGNKVD
jgi:hypothetical protein